MNVSDLIQHYVTVKTLHDALPRSIATKLPHLHQVFGSLPATCSGIDIARAARARWGSNEPGTIKRYLAQLRAVLNRAERDGLIARAPHIDMPYVFDTVVVDVTTVDLSMLLGYIKWTEPKWYPLTLVLSHTGARLSEALALDPRVDFHPHLGARIHKRLGRRTKTIARTVPYTPLLRSELASGVFGQSGAMRSTLLPQGISARSVPACLGRVLSLSCDALGLQRLRVHDLRHACASMMAEHGADLADIAAVLGHTNIAMAMRYRGLVRGRLQQVMSSVVVAKGKEDAGPSDSIHRNDRGVGMRPDRAY